MVAVTEPSEDLSQATVANKLIISSCMVASISRTYLQTDIVAIVANHLRDHHIVATGNHDKAR